MTQTEKGQFVQFPVQLIYGQAELTRDDKWVLLAIMGECWAEGTYRISYREISALADIPISLLSTFTDKKTGKYHEGIINRITRVTGYLIMETGKEINAATGKLKGNAQTYITINYARIWQDNRNYCEARKSRQVVSNKDYQPVSHTNKVVSYTNNPDSNTNNLVSNVNKPVSDLPLESPTYITKTIEDITDKNIDVNASALAPTPSQENENAYPQENTSSQHQQASTVDNSKQANKDILIATTTPQGSVSVDMPIRNTDSLFSDMPPAPDKAKQNGKGKGKPAPPKEEIPTPPKTAPVEPHAGMQWGTRKCMQWFDYWRSGLLIGKYKLTQASTCAKGLAEQFSEEQVKQARSDMSEDPYWIARGGCDICDVANNIHRYLNKKLKPTSQANGEKPRAAALAPEHIVNERKRKLLENTVTQRAEMDARKAARLAQARGE